MAKKKIEEGILDKIKTAMGGGELPDLIVNHTANAIKALGEYASSKEGADRGDLFKEDLEPLLGVFNKKLDNSDDNFKYRAAFLAELLSQYAGKGVPSLEKVKDRGNPRKGLSDSELEESKEALAFVVRENSAEELKIFIEHYGADGLFSTIEYTFPLAMKDGENYEILSDLVREYQKSEEDFNLQSLLSFAKNMQKEEAMLKKEEDEKREKENEMVKPDIPDLQEGSFRISKEKINQIISEEIRRYKRKK